MHDVTTLTITKSELKDALGCTTWARLYSKFLTPEVISTVLHMDVQAYKRIREFNVEQTRQLRSYFKLDAATTAVTTDTV